MRGPGVGRTPPSHPGLAKQPLACFPDDHQQRLEPLAVARHAQCPHAGSAQQSISHSAALDVSLQGPVGGSLAKVNSFWAQRRLLIPRHCTAWWGLRLGQPLPPVRLVGVGSRCQRQAKLNGASSRPACAGGGDGGLAPLATPIRQRASDTSQHSSSVGIIRRGAWASSRGTA
jgi:hypothetical protein